jgi:hypothetical protein
METNSLKNCDNYKPTLTNSSVEIYSKYIGIIQEYIIQSVGKICIRDDTYYKYVICQGIDAISHVFKMILLHTKNLPIAYYHCQTSFYYYIEFMEQLGENTNSFLKLSSKDATLFVYKKTIFEIDTELVKHSIVKHSIVKHSIVKHSIVKHSKSSTNTIMNNVEVLVNIYNSLLKNIICDFDFKQTDKHSVVTKIEQSLSKFSQNILNASISLTEEEYNEKLNILDEFYKMLPVSQEASPIIYFEILARKLKTSTIDYDDMYSKLLSDNNDTKLTTLTPIKYINWLTQP